MNAKNTQILAQRIVSAIIADLNDRRGLRQSWDDIGLEMLKEIRASWTSKVKKEIDKLNK